MKGRYRALSALIAGAMALSALAGLRPAAAAPVGGEVGLYVIVYGNAIDRAEAEDYASGTNTWLRRSGISRERADLSVAAFSSRSGSLDTGCNVSTALNNALTAQDRAAIQRMEGDYDYVVPVVVAPNRDGCWFAGQAFLGAPGILLVTAGLEPSSRLRVFRHELGHNLGLEHFSSAALQGKVPQLLKPLGSFRGSEYGDPLSIMGHGTTLTYTDRFLLGSLPASARVLATPQQETYVLKGKGKRDRLLAIPTKNQVRVTLEYSSQRGVEARAIYGTGSVLWTASSASLGRGASAMIADVRVQIVNSGGPSATIKVTWPQDTLGPTLAKGDWGNGPWFGLEEALTEQARDWVSLTRVDLPIILDHTTVPTYVDLKGVDEDEPGLLPTSNDAGWVAVATLIVNDDTVYESVTTNRSLTPAGTYADPNGQPLPVAILQALPLYRGRNALTYILVDAAGNQSTFHYTFTLRRVR